VDFDIIKFVSTYICACTCICRTFFFPVEILSGGKNLILNVNIHIHTHISVETKFDNIGIHIHVHTHIPVETKFDNIEIHMHVHIREDFDIIKFRYFRYMCM
jgi:hypothetical protein